jgi:hypothetical protein
VRTVLGFLVVQVALTGLGFSVLSALHLMPGPRRSVLAVGPAFLAGTALLVNVLIVFLVVGVPVTLLTAALACAMLAAIAVAVGRLLPVRHDLVADVGRPGASRLERVILGITTVYALAGVWVFARSSTKSDDARIWSLKGLALTYHNRLVPEIFLNPATGLSHPAYPIFQPVFEAVLGRAMGRPALTTFHMELWLLLLSTAWSAGYLLWWRHRRPLIEQVGLIFIGLLVLLPAVIGNVWSGYADTTGASLLAMGALALGLWLENGESGLLGLAVILLAAAANTKDEDTLGAVLILIAAGLTIALTRDLRRAVPLGLGAAVCAVLVAPWRAWTSVHHVVDGVVPSLPAALSPVYIAHRSSELKQTLLAMLLQLAQNWTWLVPIFLALCALCIAGRARRRVPTFYLLSFLLLVCSLIWLYTTTPASLSFLIPTSLGRTVEIFMVLTLFASAHLLTRLLSDGGQSLSEAFTSRFGPAGSRGPDVD